MNWTLLEEPYLGKVVCPFNPVESTLDSSKYQMALDVGDFVVVIERHGSGWFRGIDVLTRKVGIFPCSVIKRYEFLGFSSLKGGIDVREKLLNEIAPILFLWSQKVKTSIMNREYEKFSRILDLTKEIKELKELLISEKHNKDAILRLIELIKEGNRLLELPIVANESEDVEKIFTEYNSINPLIVKEEIIGREEHQSQFINLILNFKACVASICGPEEMSYLNFRLYDTRLKEYISDNFLVPLTMYGMPIDERKIGNVKTRFMNVKRNDVLNGTIFLVCHIYRYGKMIEEDFSLKNKRSSMMSLRSFENLKSINEIKMKRPFGVAVLQIKSESQEGFMKIFNLGENNFGLIHEDLINSYSNLSIEKDSKVEYICIGIEKDDELNKDIPETSLIIKDKIDIFNLFNKTEINELFFELNFGEFNQGHKSGNKNILVTIQLRREDGSFIDNCFKVNEKLESVYYSSVQYHNNSPNWNETVCVKLKNEFVFSCYLFLTFKHCSSNDSELKNFAFAIFPLNKQNLKVLVENKHHTLPLYRYNNEVLNHHSIYQSFHSNSTNSLNVSSNLINSPLSDLESFDSRFSFDDSKSKASFEDNKSVNSQNSTGRSNKAKLTFSRDYVQVSSFFLSNRFTHNENLSDLLDWNNRKFTLRLTSILSNFLKVPKMDLILFHENSLNCLFEIFDYSFKSKQRSTVAGSSDLKLLSQVQRSSLIALIFTLNTIMEFDKDENIFQKYLDHFNHSKVIPFIVQSLTIIIENHSEFQEFNEIISCFKYFLLLIKNSTQTDYLDFTINNFLNSIIQLMHNDSLDVNIKNSIIVSFYSSLDLFTTRVNHLGSFIKSLPIDTNDSCNHVIFLCIKIIQNETLNNKSVMNQICNKINSLFETNIQIDQDISNLLVSLLYSILQTDKSFFIENCFPPLEKIIDLNISSDHFLFTLKIVQNLKGEEIPILFIPKLFHAFNTIFATNVFKSNWISLYNSIHQIIFKFIFFLYENELHLEQCFILLTTILSQQSIHEDYRLLNIEYREMIQKIDNDVINLLEKIWTKCQTRVSIEFVEPTIILCSNKSSKISDFGISIFDHILSSIDIKSIRNIVLQVIDKDDIQYSSFFNGLYNSKDSKVASFAKEMMKFNDLLNSLHSIPQSIDFDSERCFAMAVIMQMYLENGLIDKYVSYLYKIIDCHVKASNWSQAAFALYEHAKMIDWDPNTYLEPFNDYPKESSFTRKCKIYDIIIDYFDKGNEWEKAIELCDEYSLVLKNNMNFIKLADILEIQAKLYRKLATVERFYPDYYRVAFYGTGFPIFFRNRQFIYQAALFEKISSFTEKLQNKFQSAKLMKNNELIDDKIKNDDQMNIQVKKVEIDLYQSSPLLPIIDSDYPEFTRKHTENSNIDCFFFDIPIIKSVNEEINEYSNLFAERICITSERSFPSFVSTCSIKGIQSIHLSPIKNACNIIYSKSRDLALLAKKTNISKSVSNPFTMALNGAIDAAVNGGIRKFHEAFKASPSNLTELKNLNSLIDEHLEIIKRSLKIHGDFVSNDLKPLHERMELLFIEMEKFNLGHKINFI